MAIDDLLKPLTKKKRSSAERETAKFGVSRASFPYSALSAAILIGLSFIMATWIAVVDDPVGGQPVVTVKVIEPKFDSDTRNVGIVSLRQADGNGTDDVATITDITIQEDQGSIEPIDPDDIIIYDPSEIAETQSDVPLSTVADQNLIERSRYGFLPVIGENGQKPVVAYSRPSGRSGVRANSVAIIIGGLGLNSKTTQEAIAELPGAATLAFAPYADNLIDWMARARKDGHELLLQLPLEPFDYPNNDPGPRTLLVDNNWDENVDRLGWLLSRMTNYVGVVNYMGARFSASPEVLTPLFNTLRDRGLMYVDDGSTPLSRAREIAAQTNIPFSQTNLVIDSVLTPDDIDARLLELEGLAREEGTAIGFASAFPITIERLKRWVEGAEKRGIRIVPISATLDRSSF